MDERDRAVGKLQLSEMVLRKAALTFLLIGPPVGALGALPLALSGGLVGYAWDLAMLFFFVVYFVGSIPALLSGMLYGTFLLTIGKREPLALQYRLIAGVLSGLGAISFFSLFLSVAPIFFTAGAIGGAASAASLRQLSCS
ncbi:hypothetical protein [Pseudomonas multiresinivorans]|uniref:Uncharacterized protein n=1 Tax=Pseudomonas multiresinivorans TaxID=95301 RepID=A0A7Z3BLS3_9PSED|nr:hypothetical protein [Pseudomonas multiresinivorans]QJP09044.1 hypothetical protein G4G71_14595 [Pseudomonas multiresinivorans]